MWVTDTDGNLFYTDLPRGVAEITIINEKMDGSFVLRLIPTGGKTIILGYFKDLQRAFDYINDNTYLKVIN